MTMELNLETKKNAGVTIIAVGGEVDLYSSPRLRDAILKAGSGPRPRMVICLAEVTYMDSSGVATLVEGLQLCNEKFGAFALCSLTQPVQGVLELARLDRVFVIFNDEAEAHSWVQQKT